MNEHLSIQADRQRAALEAAAWVLDSLLGLGGRLMYGYDMFDRIQEVRERIRQALEG